MLNVPINEFKKKIEFYLNKIKRGETLVIKDEDKSIAKVAPIVNDINGKRPIGLAKDDFIVPDDFDSPLPTEIRKMFEK